MLQIVHPSPDAEAEVYSMVLRCGNCRRTTRYGFAVIAITAEARSRARDETAMEIWSGFTCERCDYDRAFVMALGFEPTGG